MMSSVNPFNHLLFELNSIRISDYSIILSQIEVLRSLVQRVRTEVVVQVKRQSVSGTADSEAMDYGVPTAISKDTIEETHTGSLKPRDKPKNGGRRPK